MTPAEREELIARLRAQGVAEDVITRVVPTTVAPELYNQIAAKMRERLDREHQERREALERLKRLSGS